MVQTSWEILKKIDFIIECFEDPTLKVLLISAIVSLIIGLLKKGLKTGWIEGSANFWCGIYSNRNFKFIKL